MNVTDLGGFLFLATHALLGAVLVTSLAPQARAQLEPAVQSCETVLYDLAKELKDRGVVLAIFGSKGDLFSVGLEGTSIPDTVLVTPEQGKTARNIMNSYQLGLSYARRVLGACSQFKRFEIVMLRTEWINEWLRFPDGSIRPFICLYSGPTGLEDPEAPYGTGKCL